MKIEQFEDKYLSHFSYAILSECEKKIILIDPSRNPHPYYEYAKQQEATIVGVIETHSHADFVSGHVEIAQATGARIFVSKNMNASFNFTSFDEGDEISLGQINLKALNTPGHSNDSISVLLEHRGKDVAVFTGDTLFIGDVGRPDLREKQRNAMALREDLAVKMYHSLREKLLLLEDEVIVYPGHGAGTLCGKSLSPAKSSTIGNEKISNWALQKMDCKEFIKELTSNQPFIPAYFSRSVELNINGAPSFSRSINEIPIRSGIPEKLQPEWWTVDVRDEKIFKNGHLDHSVNLMEGEKFETWLGTIIHPEEQFYLAAQDEEQLKRMIARCASIGYELLIREAFVVNDLPLKNEVINLRQFKEDPQAFTIVDVRNEQERQEKKIFDHSIAIPLPELRTRIQEIPDTKPIVVHCAAGYRSAAASSIISAKPGLRTKVYDLGEAIKEF